MSPIQQQAAIKAVHQMVAALEDHRADGTRPAIPHVDTTSWIGAIPFIPPPPAGSVRTVADLTTQIVDGDTTTLHIHTTWQAFDQPPDTTDPQPAGPQRDFPAETVR